jgi:hypothetical protein
MPVAIQIEDTRAIIGIDPEMPNTWTSEDARLASDLNSYTRNRDYDPNPQYAEAQAVVAEAVADGKRASIVMVDQVEETEDQVEVVY